MVFSKNGVIYTIYDGRRRPVMICRITKRHKMMYIFMRYNNMGEADKQKLRGLYAMVINNGSVVDLDGCSLGDLDAFLSFKEQKPCG